MKPTLNPPEYKRRKLNNEKTISNFAFNFNLRRYKEGGVVVLWSVPPPSALANGSLVLDITPLHAYQPQAPPSKGPGRAFLST